MPRPPASPCRVVSISSSTREPNCGSLRRGRPALAPFAFNWSPREKFIERSGSACCCPATTRSRSAPRLAQVGSRRRGRGCCRWTTRRSQTLARSPCASTYRPDAAAAGTPLPRGILVEATLAGKTYHFPISVALQEARPHPEIVRRASPTEPLRPLGDLRLRPVGVPQAYYVHVRNPTEKPANALVQLSGADGLALGGPGRVTVPAGATVRVVFPPAAVPPGNPTAAALPELRGPLLLRLVDADNPTTVLDSRKLEVAVSLPREYVEVTAVQFQSAGPGRANQFDVRLAHECPCRRRRARQNWCCRRTAFQDSWRPATARSAVRCPTTATCSSLHET